MPTILRRIDWLKSGMGVRQMGCRNGYGTQYTVFAPGNTHNQAAVAPRSRPQPPREREWLTEVNSLLYPPLHRFPRPIRISPHCWNSLRMRNDVASPFWTPF